MKHILVALIAVAFMVAPLSARADEPGGPPNPAMFQIMEQTHAKMDQLHAQARVSMLNSLSPAHRTLLAQIVGSLAIAPSPDVAGAAKQLDANLSPAEAKAILGVSASLEQQAKQVMDAAHKQMESVMPAGGTPHGAWMMRGNRAGDQMENDPGAILLRVAAHGVEPEGGNHMYMAPGGMSHP